LFFVKSLKVVHIAELAGLTHSFSARESAVTVKAKGIVYIVKKSKEEKHSNDRCTSAAFT